MTKEEKQSYSIAGAFVLAVERLESFNGCPSMVYDDIRHILFCESVPSRVRSTVNDILNVLDPKEE